MRIIATMLVMLFTACNLSAQTVDSYKQSNKLIMFSRADDSFKIGNNGLLPPMWLKNKLTDAQYDSLAMLAKYYNVDYSYFKQRNLSQDRIHRYFKRVKLRLDDKSRLQRALLHNTNFSMAAPITVAKPLSVSVDKASKTIKACYVLYSSMDDYDAHVVLDVDFLQKLSSGVRPSAKTELKAYSVSGLKVKLVNSRLTDENSNIINQVNIAIDGNSPQYVLADLLEFEDAMGNKFTEPFQEAFALVADFPEVE